MLLFMIFQNPFQTETFLCYINLVKKYYYLGGLILVSLYIIIIIIVYCVLLKEQVTFIFV